MANRYAVAGTLNGKSSSYSLLKANRARAEAALHKAGMDAKRRYAETCHKIKVLAGLLAAAGAVCDAHDRDDGSHASLFEAINALKEAVRSAAADKSLKKSALP